MTEKVKITAEQANAIELYLTRHSASTLINNHAKSTYNNGWLVDGEYYALNSLTQSVMAKALYIGYEVEPEPCRVGDWLYDPGSEIIGEVGEDLVIWGDGIKSTRVYVEKLLKSNDIRHATPEEIQAEKERRNRKWAGIEEGDILRHIPWSSRIGIYAGYINDESVLIQISGGQEVWKKSQVELYAKKVGEPNA